VFVGVAALLKGAAFRVVLALSFVWGFSVEALDIGEGREAWLTILGLVAPWVCVLIAALVARLDRGVGLVEAVLGGLGWGFAGAVLFFFGVLSESAFDLGDGDATDLGGGILLIGWLILWGGAGAVVGAACGAAAWVLKLGLAAKTKVVRLAFMGVTAVVAVGGTSAGVTLAVLDGADDTGGWTIEEAREFEGFSLYWVGDSYEGLPLTRIIGYRYDPEPPVPAVEAESSVSFIYGDCDPPPDGGCPPPLAVVVEPCRMNRPGRFAPSVRGGPFEIRGARAEYVSGDLRIWTGDVYISIFAISASHMEVANQLRLVSEGPEGASKPLGPPNPGC
jgi:hypothetical protein